MMHECIYHTDHESRVKELEAGYKDLKNLFTELDKNTAVSNEKILGALSNLEKLPETMIEISKTMVSMQGEITKSNEHMSSLDRRVTTLSKKLEEVDEDGKFNIRKWIKENWVALCIVFGFAFYTLKDFLL